MHSLPLRIPPEADLRRAIDEAVAREAATAAFVLAGIGSLRRAAIRLAGAAAPVVIDGDLEILSLAGSVAPGGSHLHVGVADAAGRVTGGHLAFGSVVRTTAEVMLVLLPEWSFAREHDAATGFAELAVRPARS
jgi:uncharacterized protein